MAIYGTEGDDNLAPTGGGEVYGLGGNDTIVAQDFGLYRLYGGTGDDILKGEWGDDLLDGGPGADTMAGYWGSDTYVVDNPGDVIESDTVDDQDPDIRDVVRASISYSLGDGLDVLALTGAAEINGAGNGSDNLLVGNDAHNHLDGRGGNDLLDGGRGADAMSGGDGNDSYWVENRGDQVIEAAGQAAGIDEVGAIVSWRLAANIENLFLFGRDDIKGIGNGLDNFIGGNRGHNLLKGAGGDDWLESLGSADTLKGGSGDDLLFGGRGRDQLLGGRGSDEFVFLVPKEGGDEISDFRPDDVIGIYAKGFGAGLRTSHWLKEAQFESGNTNQAEDRGTRFVFRTTDETLWFDADGSGRGGPRLIADLQNGATLTQDDIWLG